VVRIARQRHGTALRSFKATEKIRQIGDPDPKHISTSFIERQNLTVRMNIRRFHALTNAFSKKIENHIHAVALFYMHYNFCASTRPCASLQRWLLASRAVCGAWRNIVAMTEDASARRAA